MTVLFDFLYRSWCPPYDPSKFPESIRDDPVNAYGLYAFAQGFRLGAQLMYVALDPNDLCDLL